MCAIMLAHNGLALITEQLQKQRLEEFPPIICDTHVPVSSLRLKPLVCDGGEIENSNQLYMHVKSPLHVSFFFFFHCDV